jgi:hypothetical protein
MKYGWLLLVLVGCSRTTSADGTYTRTEFTGNVTSGMTCEQVLYERGRPDLIEYPGPNIEEWTYVAEKPVAQRDDTIVPNPFPRYGLDVKTHRTIYRFHHRYLHEIIELEPGQTRKSY